ncbi:MAG: NfeD family protein [Eubacterium sp.]|nr:NfeD family protein [Eubacterium sp.]
MTNTMYIVWAGLIILFAVIEGMTVQLVSIWFVIGSVAGLICSLLKAPVWLQITVAVAVSIIALIITRPIIKKHITPKITPTNADRVIGKVGIVEEDIDNTKAVGLVSVDGQMWSARAQDGELIAKGEQVDVLKIEGAKIIVKKHN